MLCGVELGGMSAHAALALAEAPRVITQRFSMETTSPEATLGALREWIKQHAGDDLRAIGIASFGPVCLNTEAAEYGCITTTPKPGWKGARVVAHFEDLAGRVVFETDVNAPALLEASEAGLGELCYVTVGTGVGVGAVVRGHCLHGHSHPEAGHVPVALLPSDATFKGHCPFHGARCAEGVLRVSAIAERAGVAPRDLVTLSDEDAVWPVFAHYAAQLCLVLTLTLCPRRIVLGGGAIAHRPLLLLPLIRSHFSSLLAGYVRNDAVDHLDTYLVSSAFGPDVGLLGALHLASGAN